jgi:uncharacterized membrane protein (UPF0127 family)
LCCAIRFRAGQIEQIREGLRTNLRPSLKATVSIAIVILVLFAAVYVLLSSTGPANLQSVPSHFTVNGKTFAITYVAINESERQAGLMNRKVTNTTTMLFVFPSAGIYPFWMHNVNSSLDIMWLNVTGSAGRVVYLVTNVPGCSLALGCPNYTPTSAANYVIEAKGGFAEANTVIVGTNVQFG